MFRTWMKTLLHCGFGETQVNHMTYEPMHSAQAKKFEESRKKKNLFVGHHCRNIQEVRINVYFILISESSPYVLSYRSTYS